MDEFGASDPPLERERRHVIDYFENETPAEVAVERCEKVTSERIYGRKHDIWDLQASDGRWWIVTNPTNLYSQEDFPSMHTAFALHIGVAARMIARQSLQAPVQGDARDNLESTWRRFEQAAEALDVADEAEDFQAVGMRCRECLLTFVVDAGEDEMVPGGTESPKHGDFVAWAELLADAWASGSRLARLRSYLKTMSGETWRLVNWLTHDRNAYRHDVEVAVECTGHLVSVFASAMVGFQHGETDRCPQCGSYQLSDDYDAEEEYSFRVCARCDWQGAPRAW